MAKKDKTDGTPIEFYIPGPGKAAKVPVPINQPNWIYKRGFESKPSIFEWLNILILLTVVTVLGIVLVVESMYESFLWIVVVALGIFVVLQVRSAIIRTFKYTQEVEDDENIVSPTKRKKKFPKHRKNYK
jgi:hypothetical protein